MKIANTYNNIYMHAISMGNRSACSHPPGFKQLCKFAQSCSYLVAASYTKQCVPSYPRNLVLTLSILVIFVFAIHTIFGPQSTRPVSGWSGDGPLMDWQGVVLRMRVSHLWREYMQMKTHGIRETLKNKNIQTAEEYLILVGCVL